MSSVQTPQSVVWIFSPRHTTIPTTVGWSKSYTYFIFRHKCTFGIFAQKKINMRIFNYGCSSPSLRTSLTRIYELFGSHPRLLMIEDSNKIMRVKRKYRLSCSIWASVMLLHNNSVHNDDSSTLRCLPLFFLPCYHHHHHRARDILPPQRFWPPWPHI